MAWMSEAPRATLACCGLIGTTVADDGLVERAFAEAIAAEGIVPGTSAYTRCMVRVHRSRGQATADVMSGLFPGNQARAQAAHMVFDRSFRAAVGRTGVAPVPGAHRAMDQLRRSGVRICLITGLSRRLLGLVLEAAGWRDRVDLALSADDVPRGCPAPDLALAAMLRLGVGDVRELVVAHGAEGGVLCGRRAGAGLVTGILTGPHTATRLTDAGAHHLLASITDLPDLPGLLAAPRPVPSDAVPRRRDSESPDPVAAPASSLPAGSPAAARMADRPANPSPAPLSDDLPRDQGRSARPRTRATSASQARSKADR
jgi:phosphoglycolate phosphatase